MNTPLNIKTKVKKVKAWLYDMRCCRCDTINTFVLQSKYCNPDIDVQSVIAYKREHPFDYSGCEKHK